MLKNENKNWYKTKKAPPYGRGLNTNETLFIIPLIKLYSLCQKKRTFNSEFVVPPPGGGRPQIHMVDYVNRELPFT